MSAAFVGLSLLIGSLLPMGGVGGNGAGPPNATCPPSVAPSIGCSLTGGADLQLRSPSGAVVTCPGWKREVPDSATLSPDTELYVRTSSGVEWDLFSRVCADGSAHYRWFPQIDPETLSRIARDEVRKDLPKPDLHLSRDVDQLIVNVATTIEVTPIEPVTATATIPGLSATVTATAKQIEVVTGSNVSTGVQRIECAPWGGAGCAWTPIYPSVFKVTGTNDHRHHGSVSIVWDVAWTSTDGGGGDLGEVTTTAPVQFAVREIQVIRG